MFSRPTLVILALALLAVFANAAAIQKRDASPEAYRPFRPPTEDHHHHKRDASATPKKACAKKSKVSSPSATSVIQNNNNLVATGSVSGTASFAQPTVSANGTFVANATASASTDEYASSSEYSASPTEAPASSTIVSSAPATSSTSAPDNSGGDPDGNGPFNGQTTFYTSGYSGNEIGACGGPITDGDMYAAASSELFNTWPGNNGNPNENPICDRWAKVEYQGKSVTVQIKDECPTCDKRHLDLTRGAFNVLASEDVGMMDVTWSWV